jgi:hypothetical protein
MTTETYQGKPCAHGHDGTRYASNRKCVACSRREVRWLVAVPHGSSGYSIHGPLYSSAQRAREVAADMNEADLDRAELWRATRVK